MLTKAKFFKQQVYILSVFALLPVNVMTMGQQQAPAQSSNQVANNKLRNQLAGIGLTGFGLVGLKHFVPAVGAVWRNYAEQHPVANAVTLPGMIFLTGTALSIDYQRTLNKQKHQVSHPTGQPVLAKGITYSGLAGLSLLGLQQLLRHGIANMYGDFQQGLAEHPKAKWCVGSALLFGAAAYAWSRSKQADRLVELIKDNNKFYLMQGTEKIDIDEDSKAILHYISFSTNRKYVTAWRQINQTNEVILFDIAQRKITLAINMHKRDIVHILFSESDDIINVIFTDNNREEQVITYCRFGNQCGYNVVSENENNRKQLIVSLKETIARLKLADYVVRVIEKN